MSTPVKNEAVVLDDLVFEKRNKKYGAFDLRRGSAKYTSIAMGCTLFLFTLGIYGPKVYAALFPEVIMEEAPKEDLGPGVLSDAPPMDPNKLPPPPPPDIIEPPKMEQFVEPDLTDEEINKQRKSLEEIAKVAIGPTSSDGTVGLSKLPAFTPPKIVAPVVVKPVERKKEVKIEEMVDEEAYFPGGYEVYFQNNFKMPTIARETGVKGVVIVTFVVDVFGSISQINITKGLTGEVNKEVTRTLQTMPAWVPGKLDGKSVTSRHQLTIKLQ